MRIGSIIIRHLSKLRKVKFFILCDAIFPVKMQAKFDIQLFKSCEAPYKVYGRGFEASEKTTSG